MAQVITKLYRTVRRGALFFLPQFDLKQGKYIYDTTAKVIEERCNGKVIFILSEYFFASHVCQFAVQFAAALAQGAGNGNLIPFHLTNKLDHVPAVLKGIAGIRWFRRATRKHVWDTMTDTILGGEVSPDEMEELKTRIETIVEKDESIYLADAPYDTDTPSPGKPIEIIEPESLKNLFPTPDDWKFEPIPSRPSKFKQLRNFLSKKTNKLRHAFGKKNVSSDSPHSSMSPQSESIVRGEIEALATGSSRSSIEIGEDAVETTASSSAMLRNSNVFDNSVATNSSHVSTGASYTQTCVNGNGNESKPTKYVSSSETEPNSDSMRSMQCEHQCSVNTPQNKQDVQEQVNEQHRNHRLNILESGPEDIRLQDLSSTQQREPTEHEEDHTVLYRRQNTRHDGDVGGDRQETLSLVENEDTFHSCDGDAV